MRLDIAPEVDPFNIDPYAVIVDPSTKDYTPDLNVSDQDYVALEEITIAVIDVLQERCGEPGLRTYIFNVMAYDYYDNANFDDLMKYALSTYLNVLDRDRQTPYDTLALDVAEEIVGRYASYMYASAPWLDQELGFDDRLHAQITRTGQEFARLVSGGGSNRRGRMESARGGSRSSGRYGREPERGSVRGARTGGNLRGHGGGAQMAPARRPNSGGRNGGRQTSARDVGLNVDGVASGRTQSGPGLFRRDRPTNHSQEEQLGNVVLMGQENTTPEQGVGVPRKMSALDAIKSVSQTKGNSNMNRNTFQAPTPMEQIDLSNLSMIETLEDGSFLLDNGYRIKEVDGSMTMTRTPEKPFVPCWSVHTHIGFYIISPEGAVDIQVFEREDADKMQYEKHKTAKVQRAERERQAMEAARAPLVEIENPIIAAELPQYRADVPKHSHVVVSDNTIVENIDTAIAINEAAQRSINKGNEDELSILTTNINIVSLENGIDNTTREIIDSLANAERPIEAVNVLTKAFDTHANNASTVDGLKRLDRRLTQAINSVLRNDLGSGTIYVDSFYDTFNELIPGLADALGSVFSDAIVNHEYLIERAVNGLAFVNDVADDELVSEYFAMRLGMRPAQETGGLTAKEYLADNSLMAFNRPVSVTNLRIDKNTLGLNLTEGSALLRMKENPLLTTIAEKIVLKDKLQGLRLHLVVTTDGFIYQLTRSALSDKQVIISEYNKSLI